MKRPQLVPSAGGPPAAEDSLSLAISPIEEIIEDARNGRPYILVDAEDRENEGDVIIPAQFATPDQINFMAKHARGLICLSITTERARQLRLPPMAIENQSGHGTAFTVSVEAREGVTTGISAHDRAHTVAVAVDPTKGPQDIVSPGHVFPLVAKDGGVLVRAGHTEAAVDISRMAGLIPAGVICEIMNDDGSMARLPDLVAFAQLHGLKIGTIADLIAYRRRTERQVERVLETPFESAYGGRFRMLVYRNVIDRTEHVVLTKGKIDPDRPTLVRMHRVDMAGAPGLCAQGAPGHLQLRRRRRGRVHPRLQSRLAVGALWRGRPAAAREHPARLRHRRADPAGPGRARHRAADRLAADPAGLRRIRPADRRHPGVLSRV
jgi:3,4-dihydroxy 2-butanone 4-phosphate synthase/GTP cyclohydrolase II